MRSSARNQIGGWSAPLARGAAIAGALAFVLASLALAANELPAAGREATSQSVVWKDPDGNPLPFQSEAEIIEFLRTAEIESVDDIPIGITNPRQVILEKDGVRMRAALRDYDETFEQQHVGEEFYARLRDSFVFDIAAYRLSRLLQLDNIPPVTFRRLGGQRITLQIWLEGMLMETDRRDRGLDPVSFQHHRQQEQNMRVFDSLIGNVDRNTGNIFTNEDGDFWLIDHSRSFMRNDNTRYLERINMCGRGLFARIKSLQREQLQELLSPPLTASEVDWVLQRRDKVVAHIEELIATRGDENIVLFDDSR